MGNAWSGMTLNYPHEGSVMPKANAVVGSLIPGREITTLPDEKLRRRGKVPHVCQKEKEKGNAYGHSNSSPIS